MCIEIVKSDAAFHKPFLLLYRISAKNAAPQDLNEALEYISKAPKDLNETSEDLHKPQNYSEIMYTETHCFHKKLSTPGSLKRPFESLKTPLILWRRLPVCGKAATKMNLRKYSKGLYIS